MTTVGMYYDVIPEKAEIFLSKFRAVVAALSQLEGHRNTWLYQRVDDPHSYAVLSEWDNPQTFLDFIRSPAFREVTAWGKEEVLRNPPRHKIYPRAEEMGRPTA